MIDFSNIHPLILDVALISVFILIIFFGALKGIKNALIDFLIFTAAFLLSFSPLMNSVKEIFVRELLNVDKIVPAGSNSVYKLGISFFVNVFSAFIMFVFLYIVFLAIQSLIKLILKRPPKPKRKVERVFGAIFSLIYQGSFLLLLLVLMNNKLVGLNNAFDKSSVTNFMADTTQGLLTKSNKSLDKKITLKFLKGDLFSKVSEDGVESFKYLEEKVTDIFSDKKYIDLLDDYNIDNDDLSVYMKERILDLEKLAIMTIEIDQFGISKERFSDVGEVWFTAIHRNIFNRGMNKIEFTMTDLGNIKSKLQQAGLNEKSSLLYDEITIGK